MSAGSTTVLIVVLVVVVAAVALGSWAYRRQRLRNRFGPEYERTVEQHDSRREAERELRERERRVDSLDIKRLDPGARQRYAAEWQDVQAAFVDAPGEAVARADQLVTALMGERGYPTEGYEQQAADLSVAHATTLGHYRDAHAISEHSAAGDAGTEDLRQALVHYRVLFSELLEVEPVAVDATADTTDRREH